MYLSWSGDRERRVGAGEGGRKGGGYRGAGEGERGRRMRLGVGYFVHILVRCLCARRSAFVGY